jgi:hypothetical protein
MHCLHGRKSLHLVFEILQILHATLARLLRANLRAFWSAEVETVLSENSSKVVLDGGIATMMSQKQNRVKMTENESGA